MSRARTRREARAAAERRRAKRGAEQPSSTRAADDRDAVAAVGLRADEPIAPSDRIPSGARRASNFSTLEVAAEAEYAYIARDVRRIIRIGGGTLGLMFGLRIVLDLAGAI